MPSLELTEAEHLALRYVLDNWVLTSSAEGNAPFCYMNCLSISKKLGEAPDDLWGDPVCAAWYKDFQENFGYCDVCGVTTAKVDLVVFDEVPLCDECLKDAQND